MSAARAVPWSPAHPLWLCPFRPFFMLALVAGWALMGLWGGFLLLGWPLPAVPGGPFVWHAHELLLGFALAGAAGFVLTSVPEFTRTPAFGARPVRVLVGLWLAGRLGFWCSGWWPLAGLAVAALAQLGLIGGLMGLLAPRLLRDPGRRHVAFLWALALLAFVAAGFYVDALRGVAPTRWLHALVGVWMGLIVIAMSRISMSIVNASIDAQVAADGRAREPYLARPPRRNLALLAIGGYTLAEFLRPGGPVSAWLALAAAAAALNLLNDWHVGRPLLRRWPLLLYVVYVLMALGYALTGLALLGGGFSPNAGLHVLTTGAIGLNIYLVICIAGYTHSGLEKSGRPWVPWGAALLVAAALARASAYAVAPAALMGVAAALWCAAFALQSARMLPVFWRPRADGAGGCDGLLPPRPAPASAPRQSTCAPEALTTDS
ncbi:NnrS family protein [Ottowia sp.]|uniref:NnrS family protein n=1 Tax=Ottowia sp. TaxID=1898956 RepID=UPI0025E83382|nr:NnrS family protein [Ottowia sp.]